METAETAPKHPSVWTLIVSQDSKNLQVMEQMVQGHIHSRAQCVHPYVAGRWYERAEMEAICTHGQSWPMKGKGTS